MKSVTHRLIFAPLMIAAVVALLYGDVRLERSNYGRLLPPEADGALFALLAFVLTVWAVVELSRMTRAKGLSPVTAVGAAVAGVLAVSPFLARLVPAAPLLPLWVLGFGTLAIFAAQAALRRTSQAIANIAATLLAVCYPGALALFVVLIRVEFATAGLLLFLTCVKFTDIAAWAVGSRFGRHKVIPWLSPGKSWEGLAGGTAVAVIASLAIAPATGLMGWWQAMAFGLLVGPAGQLGDLAESLLKRDSGSKDSGSSVPSFGGVLDIIDSPLGAAPVGYLLLMILA